MPAISFRVSDAMHTLIVQEAEAMDSSAAGFAREAVVIRAVAWAHRRGMPWADADMWEPVYDALHEVDEIYNKRRAELATERRLKKFGK